MTVGPPHLPTSITAHAASMVTVMHSALRALADDTEARVAATLRRDLADIDAAALALLDAGTVLPDLAMRRRYGLNDIDMLVLWLAAAPHLEPTLRDTIARCNDNVLADHVDGALCQRVFADDWDARLAIRSSLLPGGVLRSAELLSLQPPRGRDPHDLMRMELVPTGDVLAALHGVRALSPESEEVAKLIEPSRKLDGTLALGVAKLRAVIAGFFASDDLNDVERGAGGLGIPAGIALVAFGAEGTGRSATVRAIAGDLGRRVIEVNGEQLSFLEAGRARRTLHALVREAELHTELLVVRRADRLVHADQPLALTIADAIARRRVAVVFVMHDASPCAPALERMVVLRQGIAQIGAPEFLAQVWRASLPPGFAPEAAELDPILRRWSLTPLQARKAAVLGHLVGLGGTEDLPAQGSDGVATKEQLLESAAQNQVPFEAGAFAVMTHPTVTFDDLVLGTSTRGEVLAIAQAVRDRARVLRTWRLGQRIRRGLGITCLFDGEPGTGKTLAAEVIASSLQFALVRINIATIVDKYIGETEKNLSRIFETARPDTSILLFDEADSIFAKRTEVKHSNDRYANMNVNVLLQLIEAYEGVAVLTTNLQKNIDPAFERRMMFKVSFAMPEHAERASIWQRLLPSFVPTGEEIDYDYLAEVELSGGSIKNAIIKAAYAAARGGTLLANEHLIAAAFEEARASGHLVREF